MKKGVLALAICGALLATAASNAMPGPVGSAGDRYTIVFNQPSGLPANVEQIVGKAGGSITVKIPQIGAVGAVSSDPNFLANIRSAQHVKSADTSLRVQVPEGEVEATDAENNGGTESPPGPDPQLMPDSLGFYQWDKMRVNATVTGSYAIQRGRRDVVVAVLDTGADVLPTPHLDIAPNLDFARSASFVTAAGTELPAPDHNPAAWDDRHGHGSWCLSAVGAPINELGVSGIAPNITMVALKVLGDTGSGTFLGVANALVYSGDNHFDVASMSLGGYIWKSVDHADYQVTQRALQYARSNGVLSVAALGNDGFDLSDGSFMGSFVEAPGEFAGVVGVSATNYYNEKSHYSNYGMGKTDVSAPGGGTRRYDGVPGSGTPPPPYTVGQGRVIGAWSQEGIGAFPPVMREEECTGPGGTPPCSYYAWVQGTSMATPHVAGVAALIVSQYGEPRNNQNKPHMSPTELESLLQISANNRPCPEPNTVIQGPGFPIPTATCSGDVGYNNFFGKGIVDAVKAVTVK